MFTSIDCPAVFEADFPFMVLRQEHAEEVCDFFWRKRIEFSKQAGPGRTVKISFATLGVSDVERLMMELSRASS